VSTAGRKNVLKSVISFNLLSPSKNKRQLHYYFEKIIGINVVKREYLYSNHREIVSSAVRLWFNVSSWVIHLLRIEKISCFFRQLFFLASVGFLFSVPFSPPWLHSRSQLHSPSHSFFIYISFGHSFVVLWFVLGKILQWRKMHYREIIFNFLDGQHSFVVLRQDCSQSFTCNLKWWSNFFFPFFIFIFTSI